MNQPHGENLQEGISIRGRITVRRHPAGTIEKYYDLARQGRMEEAQALIRSGEVAVQTPNTIVVGPSCGKDLIVQWIVSGFDSTIAYPYGPQFGEIGTSGTATAVTDRWLGAPVARSTTTYAVDSALTTAVLQFFFPDTVLSNQTYREFGTFVGGTSSLNTGKMFNHALFSSAYVKTAGTDTTVEVDITVS
jgi:hypothetical protein